TGQTTATATGLAPGIYYVTVTDNSCIPKVQTDSIVISYLSTIAIGTYEIGVKCFGNSDGVAIASASGGTPPYSYTWITAPPQYTATVNGLPAGNYTVTVTDATGCAQVAIVTVT